MRPSFTLPGRTARAVRLLLVLGCAWTLTAAYPLGLSEAQLKEALQASTSDRMFETQWGIRDLVRTDGSFEQASHTTAFLLYNFMNGRFYEDDTFFQYAIGDYLARHPEETYESFRSKFNVPQLAGMTEQTFNFYRGFGISFAKSRASGDGLDGLAERLRLLESRMPRHFPFLDLFELSLLLRDEERLYAVLTDEEAAWEFVQKADVGVRKDIHRGRPPQIDLGPIFTGVTPGTGS